MSAYVFEDPDEDQRQFLVEPDQRPERVSVITTYPRSTGDLVVAPWVHLTREQVQVMVDGLVDWLDDQ